MPNRGHSLTIDHGWQEVAQTALDFVKRFVPATPSEPAPTGAGSLGGLNRRSVTERAGHGVKSDGDRPDHAVPAT